MEQTTMAASGLGHFNMACSTCGPSVNLQHMSLPGWKEPHSTAVLSTSVGQISRQNRHLFVPIERIVGSERLRGRLVASAAVQQSTTVVENGVAREAEKLGELITSNDYIGFGSLLENNNFFRERFVIRFGEVGAGGRSGLMVIAALLQEAASNHVQAMSDFQFGPGKEDKGNITAVARMEIEVDRYPEWRDCLEIDTWFQAEGKNSVRREWIVRDLNRDEITVRATSFWIIMNTETRRLKRFSDDDWQNLSPWMRDPPKFAFSAESTQASSIKIPKLNDDTQLKVSGLIASDENVDMNKHVNNICYMAWMLEAVPEEVKRQCEVSKIILEYRREAHKGEPVESLACPEPLPSTVQSISIGGNTLQYCHLVQTTCEGKEVNRGRTVWRQLE